MVDHRDAEVAGELLGKADPDKGAAHVGRLTELYEGARTGQVILVHVDEAHSHHDMDLGGSLNAT